MIKSRDAESHIADAHDAAGQLRLVDSYIQQRRKLGGRFVIPAPHQGMLPLLDRYDDLGKFVAWAKRLRDDAAPNSTAYIALNEFYRTLEIRFVQQQRRERAKRAMMWLEAAHPKLGYEAKLRWLRKLEQQWGRNRLQYLKDRRKHTHDNRLSSAERDELLTEYWREVDKSITKGDLPSP